MRHLVTHLVSLGALVAVFLSAGVLVEHLVSPVRQVRAADSVTRLTLGIVFWIAVLFAVAAIGALRLSVVGGAAAMVMLAAAAVVWRDGTIRTLGHSSLRRGVRPNAAMLALVPAAVVLVALLFESLTSDVGWDASVAHLTVPKLYLANGGFRRVAFNVYSYWPLNMQLLYAFAMMIHDYIVAKLLHLMFLVLCAIVVYRLAARYSSYAGGSVAAMLLLANPVVVEEARVAYIDLGFAFFFLMAFAFALEHLDTRRTPPLALAGICCGVVAGTKLLGAVAAPCIAVLVIVSRAPGAGIAGLRNAARDVVLCVVLPAFVLALPWYARSYWYTGNPVYPLFYGWFGGPEWNASLSEQFLRWQQAIGMGRRPLDYLLLPVRVALNGGNDYQHFDGRINPLWAVLVPFSLVFGRAMPVVRRALGVAGLYFVTWALTSQQARFLIPVIPLLAIAAGVVTDNVVSNWLSSKLGRILTITGACLLLLWSSRFVLADGARVGRAMFVRSASLTGDENAPVYRFINDNLPSAARLLLLNTNQGFFINREYVADSFFEASQINALILQGSGDAAEMSRRLHAMGITHILLSADDWDIPYPPELREFLADRRLTERLYSCPDRTCVLFRVRM